MRNYYQKITVLYTMEELTANIWSDVDHLLNKNKIQKSVDKNLCNICKIPKVITREGFPTCPGCGIIDSTFIDDTPEWTSGVTEDGKVNDPSRCSNVNANPELFSNSWGKGTVITTHRGSSYENKRMAKINFHQSMNHKDRSLFHAYKDIDEFCYTLPDSVLKDAKMMYKKFNEKKLTRGAVRTGIKANCVLFACRMSKIPRTTKEISDMFSIQPKDISRTSQMFKEIMLGKTSQIYTTMPYDVMNRLLNSFELSKEERLKCHKMCSSLEECSELMSKTPNSVASVIIYTIVKDKISKNDICEKCLVSIPTINKIENIIKKYLEDKVIY